MQNIKDYIIVFLTGALIISLSVMAYLLNTVKPVINTQSYVEKLDQHIGKLKQDGTGNSQTVTPIITIEPSKQKKVRKSFLGIKLKRKIKN